MKKVLTLWGWWLRQLVYVLVVTIVCTWLLSVVLARANDSEPDAPAWSAPAEMAVRRFSSVTGAQREPNSLSNLSCTPMTYRMSGSNEMQSGCFTDTAFGMMDSDAGIVVYGGTDEGVPILPAMTNQSLAPWPNSIELLSLDPVNTGGDHISLYKNALLATDDKRNAFLKIVAKQLKGPPELPLTAPNGQRLVINPQTVAFSDSGSWLAVETLTGSFVRINLSSLQMKAFAASYGASGSPGLLKSRVAVSSDGDYVAIANDVAGTFNVYDLTSCNGGTVDLQPENCRSYDYKPFLRSQISGLKTIRHVRFVNERLLSFEAITDDPARDGIYELAPTGKITSLTDYIGLGDSYSSGEGAFDYLDGTDSGDNLCHLAARSYPLLLTHDLFSNAGGHSVACSGASINDVGSMSDTYRGQVRGGPPFQALQQKEPALLASVMTNFVPGYVAQQRFVRQYQPGVVTVSVGGNDIGFGDLIQTCVTPHLSRHPSNNTCFNTYEDRLEITNLVDRTVPKWAKLYKQLMSSSPGTRLYAIGYPQIMSDRGRCGINVNLSTSELEFGIELTNYVNDRIKQAANEAGINYVDISQALAGHRLCESPSYNLAVNGLTSGKDVGLFGIGMFGKESYHPNALGQNLIEQAILQKTHNLTIGAAAGASAPGNILSAPKTGRAVVNRIPVSQMTTPVTKKGQSVGISISGAPGGLKPKTAYTAHIDGPNGQTIGVVTTDENGDVNGSGIIPPDIASGGHNIDVTGENQTGEPVDVTQPVYVPDSDTDSDGDGSVDAGDSCPEAFNSGKDDDADGIDDICDPLIGQPPGTDAVTGPGSTGNSPTSSTVNDSSPPNSTTSQPSPTPGKISSQLTMAATFAINKWALPAPKGLTQTPGMANVLGTATVNPSHVNPASFIPPRPAKSAIYHPRLPLLNLLPWLLLAVLLWMLILLSYYLVRRCYFRSQAAY